MVVKPVMHCSRVKCWFEPRFLLSQIQSISRYARWIECQDKAIKIYELPFWKRSTTYLMILFTVYIKFQLILLSCTISECKQVLWLLKKLTHFLFCEFWWHYAGSYPAFLPSESIRPCHIGLPHVTQLKARPAWLLEGFSSWSPGPLNVNNTIIFFSPEIRRDKFVGHATNLYPFRGLGLEQDSHNSNFSLKKTQNS